MRNAFAESRHIVVVYDGNKVILDLRMIRKAIGMNIKSR